MKPEQVRAARGWLGWSQQDLAQRAEVGLSTLKDFENGKRTPLSKNLRDIQKALESAGVEFNNPKGISVS